jgi:uncharacterized protein YdeI (BOF family)
MIKKTMRAFLRTVFGTTVAAAVAIALSSCGPAATPVADIVKSPASFDGKEVTLRGTAKDQTRIPLVDMKSYVLKDNSGEIMILTDGELPKTDEKLTVKVKVQNLAIVNGESLGMAATEISRH